MRRVTLLLIPLALVLMVASAGAGTRQLPRISLARLLGGGGTVTIPPEWAGIWSVSDSTRDCGSPDWATDASTDTVCAGQVYNPSEGGFQLDCTGTVTTTTADVTCTGSFPILEGCVMNFTIHSVGTVTGDDAYFVETFQQTFVPALCAFQPDVCEETHSHMHRTAPQPVSCTTATRKSTWGRLKILYR